MSFEEKIKIVLVSVLLSFLVNLIYDWIKGYRDNRKRRGSAQKKIALLAFNLEIAIVNNDPIIALKVFAELLPDYDVISTSSIDKTDFDNLHNILTFMISDGYKSNTARKETDLELISTIKQNRAS